MNKINVIFAFAIMIFCAGCSDRDLGINDLTDDGSTRVASNRGDGRMAFNSRQELSSTIEYMNACEERGMSRAPYIGKDSDELGFISLYEHNKNEFMNSLSAEERAEIESDAEGLEFALPDSIIADYQFSCLLNKNREIQIGDTVFKFVKKGIGFTHSKNADNLNSLDSLTKNLKAPNKDGFGDPMALDKGIQFIYVTCSDWSDDNFGGGGAPWKPETPYEDNYPEAKTPITIPGTNIVIPRKDVHEIEIYKRGQNGDEGWISGAVKSAFGIYASAFKYFSKDRKINMNFYDQNYVIYSNIGTKIKLQKKRLGIWWNVPADEMYHGWETVCIKYDLPKVVTDYFPTSSNGKVSIPTFIYAPVNCRTANDILFHIPFIEYDVKSKELGQLFKTCLQKAKDYYQASNDSNNPYNYSSKDPGLFTHNAKSFYVIYGPSAEHGIKCRSMHTKFFSKWFPCDFIISFEISNGQFSIKNIKIDFDDHVALINGVAYGAVKYKGRWLGVRISKFAEE